MVQKEISPRTARVIAEMGGLDTPAEKSWRSKGPDKYSLVSGHNSLTGAQHKKRFYPAYRLEDFLSVMPSYFKTRDVTRGEVHWQLHIGAGPNGWAAGYTNGKEFLGGHWGSAVCPVEAVALLWAFCKRQGYFNRIVRVGA